MRAFGAVKSGVSAIGDKVADVAKAGADAAKSGVTAAAEATSAGLSKAADVAKAGADAAKSGVNSAAAAAAASVNGGNQPPPGLAHAPDASAPILPDLKHGPSVKALAEKFVSMPKQESPRQRPATFTQVKESTAPFRPHDAAVYDVPTGMGSDVYHC
jgi:hypothetical protein